MATSLMGLETSTPGVTNDLTAANSEQANIQILDVHDHSSGKGAPVPTAGININSALNFNSYKGYNFLAAQFSNQTSSLSAASNKPCVYSLNGELRFIDNSGNDVQITSGGAVVGPSGSISGLSSPVTAAFASNTFTWKANSGTGLYAKMANSDVSLYEATAGVTTAVTLKSPASLAGSYNVTFPTSLPGSTQYLTMTSAGQLATTTADVVGTAMTSTGANAVAASRTRSTGTTVSAGNIAYTFLSGTISTASTTYTLITGATLVITTSGRPVQVMLVSGVDGAFFGPVKSGAFSTATLQADYLIRRDGNTVVGSTVAYNMGTSNATTNTLSTVTSPCLIGVDIIGAGTYTYTALHRTSDANYSSQVKDAAFIVIEL